VNGVAPGPIWTPLQVSGGATMEKLETFGGDTPLGRPGQPIEPAGIYVRLAKRFELFDRPGLWRRRGQGPALAAGHSPQIDFRAPFRKSGGEGAMRGVTDSKKPPASQPAAFHARPGDQA